MSRKIFLNNIAVGGNSRITVQSMTNTDSCDVDATSEQIRQLYEHGCDIIRVAVPNPRAADCFGQIVSNSAIPVIADIHFDYRLALSAMDAGAASIRINPGNIAKQQHLQAIAKKAIACKIPLRIGVNSGSLDSIVYAKYGRICAEALCESAEQYCTLFESFGCRDLKVSLKASDVPTTVAANRLFAKRTDFPLHLGVTETGTLHSGIIKSAAGIGCLLLEGIGDTIRVSLTAPPVEEVKAGIKILEAVGLREANPDIIACPTCGRTKISLLPLVESVEAEIARIKASGQHLSLKKIALMGCIVNGPGEAKEADLGVAGGNGQGVIFKKGKIIHNLCENELLPTLFKEIQSYIIK